MADAALPVCGFRIGILPVPKYHLVDSLESSKVPLDAGA